MATYTDSLNPNCFVQLRNLGLCLCANSHDSVSARVAGDYEEASHWRILNVSGQTNRIVLKSRSTGSLLCHTSAAPAVIKLVRESEVNAADQSSLLWTPSSSASNPPPGDAMPGQLTALDLSNGNDCLFVTRQGSTGSLSMKPRGSRPPNQLQPMSSDWTLAQMKLDTTFTFGYSGYSLAALDRTWSTQLSVHNTSTNVGANGWKAGIAHNPTLSCITVVDIGSNVLVFGVNTMNGTDILYGSLVKPSPTWRRLNIEVSDSERPSQIRCLATNMEDIFVTDVFGAVYMTTLKLTGTCPAWKKIAPVEQNPPRPGWDPRPTRPGMLQALQPAFGTAAVSTFKFSPTFTILDQPGYVWFKDTSRPTAQWTMVPRPDIDENFIISIAQTDNGIYGMTDNGDLFWTPLHNPQWETKSWSVAGVPNADLRCQPMAISVSFDGLAIATTRGELLIAQFDTRQPPSSITLRVVPTPENELLIEPYPEERFWGIVVAVGLGLATVVLLAIYAYQAHNSAKYPGVNLNDDFPPAKKSALLVTYDVNGWEGCKKVKDMLINQCGFAKENIHMLADAPQWQSSGATSRKPTSANFKSDFKEWLKSSKDGDVRLLYMDCHGGSFKRASSIEPDGKDECWGLEPSSSTDNGIVWDDEVAQSIQDNLTVKANLTIYTPACHSGGMLDLKLSNASGAKMTDGIIMSPVAESQSHIFSSGAIDPWTAGLVEGMRDRNLNKSYESLFNYLKAYIVSYWGTKSRSYLGPSPDPTKPIPSPASGTPTHEDPTLLFRAGYINAQTQKFLEPLP